MKQLLITIAVPCHAAIPEHVRQWLHTNLAAHVEQEYGQQFDPEWVEPPWTGPVVPVNAIAVVQSSIVETKS